MLLSEENGTADDIHIPVFFRPSPARYLDLVPGAGVEVVVLGTAVRVKETVIHRACIPPVVAGRAHVPVRPAAFLVVFPGRSRRRDVGILVPAIAWPLDSAIDMVGCEMPCHPVGQLVFFVVGHHVAFSVENLFRNFFERQYEVCASRKGVEASFSFLIQHNRALGHASDNDGQQKCDDDVVAVSFHNDGKDGANPLECNCIGKST